MAARYWVGGTATWDATVGTKWASTSGGAGGSTVPTAADDVFFDVNSGTGTITLSTGNVCRSLNCTGFTGTLVHPAAVTITIGDATAGAGNIVLLLTAGMTYTLGDAATSAINIATTSATLQTLAFGGKTIGNFTQSGVGGNIALISSMTQASTASVTQSGGTLHYDGVTDNAGLTHTMGSVLASGNNVKSFIFGTTTITLVRSTAGSHISIATAGSNNTVSAGSATFIGAPTSTGRLTYTYTIASVGTLILNGEGERNLVINTIGTLTRNGTNNYFDQINLVAGGTLTITTALNIIAANANSRITVWPNSTAIPSTLVLTGATRNCQHVDWQDIIFNTGGAGLDLSADVGGSGDCGGNVMAGGGTLTFTPATTQTWQGTSGGNWSDVSKWTSRVPLCQDNAIINNAFLANQTIICDRKFACKDISFAGGSGNLAFQAGIYECYIVGNMVFRSTMTWTVSSTQWVLAPRTAVTLTANGLPNLGFGPNIQSGNGGSLTFIDQFSCTSLIQRVGTVIVPKGVLVRVDSYVSNANNALQPCIWHVYGTVQIRAGGTITAFSPVNGAAFTQWLDFGGQVQLTATTAGTRTLALGGMTFPDLAIAANGLGTVAITGSNTLPRLPRLITPGTATLTLAAGTTTTIRSPGRDTLDNGNNVVTLKSATAASPATINKNNGQLALDYISLQDITFTGGATKYLGANSTNVSGNTGATFTAAPDWCPQALMAA